ncbi:hypothetical protein ACH5RR_001447 [Cinchona calisaya]|uniref:Uncharacterized protein n=1 Tax=Cinchona calisaya TaxID=153742 RepID=A0ABD3B3P1_9GENT
MNMKKLQHPSLLLVRSEKHWKWRVCRRIVAKNTWGVGESTGIKFAAVESHVAALILDAMVEILVEWAAKDDSMGMGANGSSFVEPSIIVGFFLIVDLSVVESWNLGGIVLEPRLCRSWNLGYGVLEHMLGRTWNVRGNLEEKGLQTGVDEAGEDRLCAVGKGIYKIERWL